MDKDGTCPCMNPNSLPKRIRVGSTEVGIIGLNEIMTEIAKLGLTKEDSLRTELLERVSKRNWVPDSARDKYADALLDEYRRYMEKDSSS